HKFKVQPSDNKPISLKLQQYERVVEINSTPRGAEVVLDGKKVGKTPLVLKKLDMNKVHQIEVRKAGFSPQTRNISDTEAFEVKLLGACRGPGTKQAPQTSQNAPAQRAPFQPLSVPRIDFHTHISLGAATRAMRLLQSYGIIHAVNLSGPSPDQGLPDFIADA